MNATPHTVQGTTAPTIAALGGETAAALRRCAGRSAPRAGAGR
ncbi:hypothetical protein [Cellulomonas hominis]